MNLALRTTPLVALVFLASCAKEPTEIQKAQLEPMLIGCSIAVNPTSLDVDNPIAALARLGNLSAFTNKKWSLSDDETLITASFRSDTTAFECDFIKNEQAGWDIEKVRRNGQEVFDRPTADAKRAELKAEREVKEEAERLKREQQREAERLEREQQREAVRLLEEDIRLEEIAKWQEKGYSNATYKYYAKYPLAWNRRMFDSPELRIVCNPDYPRFQLKDSQLRMMGRVGVEFQFKDSQGNVTKTLLNLTSSGTVGEAYESLLGGNVRSTKERNAKAIKIMRASSSVAVGGMIFNIDNMRQIPCI